ncbi:MAG TPA: Mut7-C RNAse domain-containing protein [Candidatus Acidoferrum sp.]|nr:Mut7-C RNAse domain-containing protein [Candidatus Acidoferrum sp.]
MKQARLRFYAQLNDFLPPPQRMQTVTHTFDVSGSVKDVIESLGVPHTEVDLILANGTPVDFSYAVRDGDRVSVYPAFRSVDISPVEHLRAQLPPELRFVADGHLGRLAAYLRMLGFDTLYRSDYADNELAAISAREKRILLTRDRGLLMRTVVTWGYCLRTTDPSRQLAEVVRHFDLIRSVFPFRRCMHCNSLLQKADKEAIRDRLLPQTREHFDEFFSCPECHRIYWKGSHYRRMTRLIESVAAPG